MSGIFRVSRASHVLQMPLKAYRLQEISSGGFASERLAKYCDAVHFGCFRACRLGFWGGWGGSILKADMTREPYFKRNEGPAVVGLSPIGTLAQDETPSSLPLLSLQVEATSTLFVTAYAIGS